MGNPLLVKKEYQLIPGMYLPEEIQKAMMEALELEAEEWARRGHKVDEIFNMIWPSVLECGKPYFITELDCHRLASSSFRKIIKERDEYITGEKYTDKYGPNDIESEISEMERDLHSNKTYFHFGIEKLDKALDGGVLKEEMLSIIGNPGSMKTSLLLNGIENWIAETNEPVVFFSLDMQKKDIYERFLIRQANCGKKVLRGLEAIRDPQYLNAKKKVIERLSGRLTIFDNKTHRWTLEEITDYIKEWTPSVVCIDFLTQLTSKDAKSDYDIARKAAVELKDIAHAYGCAVIIISQMSQASRQIQASGGMGGSAKGGPVVEENCTHEIELFRDISSSPEGGIEPPKIIATIKKSRGPGAGYSFKLDYDGPQMRFNQYATTVARDKQIKNKFTEVINGL